LICGAAARMMAHRATDPLSSRRRDGLPGQDGKNMTGDTTATEHHSYHGWPIRVSCEFEIAENRFAARSFVAPAGQGERATPAAPSVAASSTDAKAQALKAARKYIDSILVD
jgi:hypothetical protein